MLLTALKQIGDTIAESEFIDKWDRYYSPGKMDGAESVVVINLQEKPNESLTFKKVTLRDADDPVQLAHQTAYAYNHKRDQSITQRVAGSPRKNIIYVLEWPNQENIGDAADDDVISALRNVFEEEREAILEEAMQYFEGSDSLSPSSGNPVFVTVTVKRQGGQTDWPGDIPAVKEGIRSYYQSKIETTSAGTANTGVTECSVCGTRTDVYGAGATLDRLYSLKKQGWFPELNASLAWRNRPICIDCITAIETGWERFVMPQNFGAPGIRCRVIPYSLPVEDGQKRLGILIENARQDLLGTVAGTDEASRPLSNAWDEYLQEVELDIQTDVLRLAFLHYRKDQTRSNTLNWIDGVRQPYVSKIAKTAASITTSPLYDARVLAGRKEDDIQVSPTEREIFTGMWSYNTLARESTRSGDDPEPAERRFWLSVTQAMLTEGEVDFQALISAAATEIRHRADRDYESDVDDDYYSPPYDTIHISEVYCFVRTLSRLGILNESDPEGIQSMNDINDDYESLNAAVNAVLESHDSIDSSPGRRAAFILGVLASQLSSWQQRKRLNRTFMQNLSIESITPGSLPKLKTKIWEKAKTYNAQQGNYGIPWAGLHARMDEALIEGEEEGWQATRDEMQTFFTMGATMGPRLAQRVSDKSDLEIETPNP